MIIYKITNLVNGKLYIGQTTQDLQTRWYKHCHSSSGCVALHNAIKRYGKDNFSVEVIDRATNRSELNDKEKYWIGQYNSISPNGYNLTTGGNDCNYSLQSRKKMSDSIKQHWKSTPFPTSKPVFQFSLDGELLRKWESATKAAESLNLSQPDIMRCCIKQEHYKSVGGFLWSYSEDKPDDYVRLGNGLKQKVQCVETGEVFNSISEAATITGILRQNISKCCRGVQKSAGGYVWKYA